MDEKTPEKTSAQQPDNPTQKSNPESLATEVDKAEVRSRTMQQHLQEEEKERKALDKKMKKLTAEGLDEAQRSFYDNLPPELQEMYLQHEQKEGEEKLSPKNEVKEKWAGYEDDSYTPEYGKSEFSDVEPKILEILPFLEKKYAELVTVLGIIYSTEKEKLPEEIWGEVEKIFSEVPDPKAIMDWNKGQMDKGRFAHIASYLTQNFRNSTEAETLNKLYMSLSKDGRISIEQALREKMPSSPAFEMLFTSGMRPPVFPPMENPSYKVETHDFRAGIIIFRVSDSEGRTIHNGHNEPYGGGWEQTGTYVYDNAGKRMFHGEYYSNTQPSFFFNQYDVHGNDAGYLFFKTYLGAKGLEFLHDDYKIENGKVVYREVDERTISAEQMLVLRKFFRWERGKKGEEIVRDFKVRWDANTAISKLEKVVSQVKLNSRKSEKINNNHEAIQVLLSVSDHLSTVLPEDREGVLAQITKSYLRTETGQKVRIVHKGGNKLEYEMVEEKR